MNSARTRLLTLAALLVLAGCRSSTESFTLPELIQTCETFTVEICGTWTLAGDHYVGAWQDGATANLEIIRFTETDVVLHRVDFGKNQDFTANYTGTVTGRTATGVVVWIASGASRSGEWVAWW